MKKTLEDRVKRLYSAVEAEEKKRRKTPSNRTSDEPRLVKKPKLSPRVEETKDGGPKLSIKDLSQELKISTKVIRKVFRRQGIRKPSGRWEWAEGSKAYEEAKAVIREYFNE